MRMRSRCTLETPRKFCRDLCGIKVEMLESYLLSGVNERFSAERV